MAQEYNVTKAFLSTEEDKVTPQLIKTQNGDLHKFMVQLEGVQGWIGILKKPGNEVLTGDTLYGDVSMNQWNKPQFKAAQRPQVAGAPQPSPQNVSTGGSELEAKIDLILSHVENLVERFDIEQGAQKAFPSEQEDISLDDINL